MLKGSELKQLRLDCGLTLDQGAEFLGVSRMSLWRYEQEENVPGLVALAAESLVPYSEPLARYLGTLTTKEQRMITRRFQRRQNG